MTGQIYAVFNKTGNTRAYFCRKSCTTTTSVLTLATLFWIFLSFVDWNCYRFHLPFLYFFFCFVSKREFSMGRYLWPQPGKDIKGENGPSIQVSFKRHDVIAPWFNLGLDIILWTSKIYITKFVIDCEVSNFNIVVNITNDRFSLRKTKQNRRCMKGN